MWLVAELCQFYEITDVQPWSALLKQMYTLGMVSYPSQKMLPHWTTLYLFAPEIKTSSFQIYYCFFN